MKLQSITGAVTLILCGCSKPVQPGIDLQKQVVAIQHDLESSALVNTFAGQYSKLLTDYPRNLQATCRDHHLQGTFMEAMFGRPSRDIAFTASFCDDPIKGVTLLRDEAIKEANEAKAKLTAEINDARTACSIVYKGTINRKSADLTIQEVRDVGSCTLLGMYPPKNE